MDDCARGFRIGETLLPWGTRFEEPAARPCSTAYGFAALYVQLSAADIGRPVTTAAYELSSVSPPKTVFTELVKRLGPPTEIDRSEEESGLGSSDTVVLYASWERGNHSIALSLYGAPRASDHGDGIGKLYVSWTDLAAAAAPFVAAWRAASDAVARAADATEGEPAIFTVAWPIFDQADAPEAADSRALTTPRLLETPKVVADRLGNDSFAIWQGDGAWHLSHGRATVVLDNVPVQILAFAPARGGGYAAIEVGSWSVRDEYGSHAMTDAAALLGRMPGLTLERHEGHDV
ncbi:MAG: hypothetical protein NTV97_17810 [Alphaproteobacteria bacterium]|nr:hypothetical protein [Alphaproteobacteria bacterium]